MLVLVAFLEVAINRVAVPMLRPLRDAPPAWHTQLDFIGLFLLYFAGTLPVLLIAARVYTSLRDRRGIRDAIAHVALAVAALLAAIPLVIAAPDWLGFPREIAFAVAVIALVVSGFSRERDLGAQLGLIVIAVPLLVHSVVEIGARYDWPEAGLDAPSVGVARAGVMALCAAALFSPYVFAPRPFSRSVIRPVPILVAMGIAAVGAVVANTWYSTIAKAAALAVGVQLEQHQADPRLAIYLLGVATLAWTLVSCLTAASAARRMIGVGIALVVLGGYEFRWPHHYLLPLLGLTLIADATRRVREEELAVLPLHTDTPPIPDPAWQRYVAAIKSTLERTLSDVQTLTTRGEEGLASTLIVGEKNGLTVRARIERLDSSVIALDVVLGREIDEVRGATLSLWAAPTRTLVERPHPPGPPAAPLFKTGDPAFDQRFKSRGSSQAFTTLFDEGLRARAVATLDGWLALWEPEGMRYRVYPGRGAPLDHPIPLSDLALGRVANAERLVSVIELLVELAARGVTLPAPAAPSQLEESLGEEPP
jgi:hypothetical protein